MTGSALKVLSMVLVPPIRKRTGSALTVLNMELVPPNKEKRLLPPNNTFKIIVEMSYFVVFQPSNCRNFHI